MCIIPFIGGKDMTIVYLCGENSIWKIKDLELLKESIGRDDDLRLVRLIQENSLIRGKYEVKYIFINEEEFYARQKQGEDVLMYYPEDIKSQIRRLEKDNS